MVWESLMLWLDLIPTVARSPNALSALQPADCRALMQVPKMTHSGTASVHLQCGASAAACAPRAGAPRAAVRCLWGPARDLPKLSGQRGVWQPPPPLLPATLNRRMSCGMQCATLHADKRPVLVCTVPLLATPSHEPTMPCSCPTTYHLAGARCTPTQAQRCARAPSHPALVIAWCATPECAALNP